MQWFESSKLRICMVKVATSSDAYTLFESANILWENVCGMDNNGYFCSEFTDFISFNMRKSYFLFALAMLLTPLANTELQAQKAYPLQFSGYDEGVATGKKPALKIRQVPANARAVKKQPARINRLTGPLRAEATGYVPTIYGTVIFSNNWTSATRARGVYSFPASATNFALTQEKVDNSVFNAMNGYGYDGIYSFTNAVAGSYSNNYYLNHYSTDSWTPSAEATQLYSSSYIGTDLAYDPTTEKVYGVFPNSGYGADHLIFGTLDPDAGYNNVAEIASFDSLRIVAIAASQQGQIYAFSTQGDLYRMDKATGARTLVGNTGVTPSDFLQSAAFDPKTGNLYWASTLADSTSALYSVDTATAKATQVLRFPHDEEIVGLYIPAPVAEDDAPAAVYNLRADFANGSLTGTVSFQAPAKTYVGGSLTGDLTYYIIANTDTIATGSTRSGADVTATVTLPREGQTQVKVAVKNAAGLGPVAKTSFWAGYDKPLPPARPSLNLNKVLGRAIVSWDKVTESVHGSYVDAANVTYDVIRYPGAVKVSQGQKANSFQEIIPRSSLANVYYQVIAKNGTQVSDTATTNSETYGDAFKVPFKDDLTNSNDPYIGFYSVVDHNQDGTTWTRSYSGLRYSYNMTNAADDWLLTPPVHFEQGKDYMLTATVHAGYSGTERLAIGFGLGTDTVGAYRQILAPTEVKGTDGTTIKERFTPGADGDYRVGFHALSDADQYYLYLDSLSIEEATSLESPDTLTDLRVTAAAKGALEATISFTAPTKAANGNALTDLTQIVVTNGNDTVHVFTAPKPGEQLTCTDTHARNGINTYTVRSYNSHGQSEATKAEAWVGIDSPLAPTNIKTLDLGDSVRVSWNRPSTEKGIHGGYVDPATIRYSLYDASNGMAIVVEHIKDTVYMDKKVHMESTESQGGYIYYSLYSEARLNDTTYAEGGSKASGYLRTGKPQVLPFKESVPNGTSEADGCWGENNYYYSWGATTDLSVDNDKGALAFTTRLADGDWSIWHTPKVSLKGAAAPALIFSYYAYAGKDITLEVQAMDNHYEPKVLKTINYKNDNISDGWHRVTVDLSAYKDSRYVICGIKGILTATGEYAVIDDVEMRDVAGNDLSIGLSAPSTANAGSEMKVTATVTNERANTAKGYTVDLYRDGKRFESKQGDDIGFGQSTQVVFTYTPAITDNSIRWQAVLNYAADDNAANDTTAVLTTKVKVSNYPTAQNVKASQADGGVQVTWDAMSDNEGATVTDGFEDYPAWTKTDLGEWSTLDVDGGYTYALGNTYPFTGSGYPMAYIVMNPSAWIIDNAADSTMLAPHSGRHYLASFDAYMTADQETSIQDDDWLISPELSGRAQTVSFYAKSVEGVYKETFEVLYSEGGTAPSDFKSLAIVKDAPANWTLYQQALPAGAKRFAIRNISKKCHALFLDDVTYEGNALIVDHYNVYRDSTLIGQATKDNAAFTDTAAPRGSHKYQVSVVYTSGESALSAAAVVDVTTGITELLRDGISINASAGRLSIEGATGRQVSVYDLAGSLCFSGKAGRQLSLTLNAGVYLVSIEGNTVRVVVK